MPPSHLQKQSHTRNVSSSDADLIGNRRAVSCAGFRRTTKICDRRRKRSWSVNDAPEFPFRKERRRAAAVRHHRLVRHHFVTALSYPVSRLRAASPA